MTDVEWETHEDPEIEYGDWGVENRYEFASVVPGRLKIVKKACESGKCFGIFLNLVAQDRILQLPQDDLRIFEQQPEPLRLRAPKRAG